LFGISGASHASVSAVIYFVLIYVFSNLAAFGVVGIVTTATGRETIQDFKAFYQNNKFLSWVLALAMFSLAGVPPTAGFFGKLFLIIAGAKNAYLWYLVVAALNLVVSLFYYLKVVRAVFMDKNENPIETIKLSASEKLGLIICSAGILLVGLLSWIYQYISQL
jgi:NADH-quinone oxidoreductase subunit N